MIEAREVSYRVGSAALVERVSLAVEPGRVLALVGPNGAGKSTLLKLLSGELAPTSGEVRLQARPLAGWRLDERARMRAVLSQSSPLSFGLSAREVVLLGRAPHSGGGETAHDRAIAQQAMAATGTAPLAERSYPTLSGGEQQRVHAARVLSQVWEPGPRALFLDEPTASLDLQHQHGLLSLARRTAAGGCAVLCVLHDLNLAAQYADRVAVLHRGRLRALGEPAEVLTPALLAEVFGVRAHVIAHPELHCPLIVPIEPMSSIERGESP